LELTPLSKVNQETLKKSIAFVRENRKERKFVETMDLQILLRDYNPDKEKRFNSSMVLPNQAKSNIKVSFLKIRARNPKNSWCHMAILYFGTPFFPKGTKCGT
jgi:ribosomal protein L1